MINAGRFIPRDVPAGTTVFLIGMRVNDVRRVRDWWYTAVQMPRMLKQLSQHPELGLLSYQTYLGRSVMVVSYWSSPESSASSPAPRTSHIWRPGGSSTPRSASAERSACGTRPTCCRMATTRRSTSTCRTSDWAPLSAYAPSARGAPRSASVSPTRRLLTAEHRRPVACRRVYGAEPSLVVTLGTPTRRHFTTAGCGVAVKKRRFGTPNP
jgi:hypothetical protein